jgi:hypothetical protein
MPGDSSMPRETLKARKPAKAPAVAAKVAVKPIDGESSTRTTARSTPVDAGRRRALIAEAAYYRSLHQGGSEVEHWLAAEQEVDAKLMKSGKS